jgi:hypothetical protein
MDSNGAATPAGTGQMHSLAALERTSTLPSTRPLVVNSSNDYELWSYLRVSPDAAEIRAEIDGKVVRRFAPRVGADASFRWFRLWSGPLAGGRHRIGVAAGPRAVVGRAVVYSRLLRRDQRAATAGALAAAAAAPRASAAAPSPPVDVRRVGKDRFDVRGRLSTDGVIVLNQAFDPHWSFHSAGRRIHPVVVAGLVNGFRVPAGDVEGTLRYDGDRYVKAGAVVTAAAFVLSVAYLLAGLRRRRSARRALR